MITEEALPTYMTMLNSLDVVRDETGASQTPWCVPWELLRASPCYVCVCVVHTVYVCSCVCVCVCVGSCSTPLMLFVLRH